VRKLEGENSKLEVELMEKTNRYRNSIHECEILTSKIDERNLSLREMETKYTDLQEKLNETEKLISETKEVCNSEILTLNRQLKDETSAMQAKNEQLDELKKSSELTVVSNIYVTNQLLT
jgi:DNA repair exonuclease SbcCD ATPase subunit